MLRKLEETRSEGFPVRVRYQGLLALAVIPPVGHYLLRIALDVLDPDRLEKDRYYPLSNVLQLERSILEAIFPDAPSTVPEHQKNLPQWLIQSPIEEIKNGSRDQPQAGNPP